MKVNKCILYTNNHTNSIFVWTNPLTTTLDLLLTEQWMLTRVLLQFDQRCKETYMISLHKAALVLKAHEDTKGKEKLTPSRKWPPLISNSCGLRFHLQYVNNSTLIPTRMLHRAIHCTLSICHDSSCPIDEERVLFEEYWATMRRGDWEQGYVLKMRVFMSSFVLEKAFSSRTWKTYRTFNTKVCQL